MHLVFVNQYYPPDAAPTGVMLEALAERLASDGHRVTVVTSAGGYSRAAGSPRAATTPASSGVQVVRIRGSSFGRATFLGKLADYLSFYSGVAWALVALWPQPDRIVALTTPPYLSVLARVLSKIRGADHAHWVMDLYPDVMVAHGMMREGGVPHRALAGLGRWGFGGRRCGVVATLGPDMAGAVGRYVGGIGRVPVEWVPLWGSGSSATGAGSRRDVGVRPPDLRGARGWKDDELVVMYSGNMGLGHRFGEIFAAAQALQDRPLRFAFFGGGKRRAEVEAFVRENPRCQVELHDYAPAGNLHAHLRSADVHLVSLAPEWTGTMIPSKLQGIFAVGRPVVFIGNGDSSIGRWVAESGGGWLVRPGDVPALQAALEEASDPMGRRRRGEAAASYARSHFDQDTNTRRLATLFATRANRSLEITESVPKVDQGAVP
ncbi:glycosyltransferase family 4 protein [soil metagenome]